MLDVSAPRLSPPAQAQAQPLSPTRSLCPQAGERVEGLCPQLAPSSRSLQPLPGLSSCLADLPSPAHHQLGEASPRVPAQRCPLLHMTSMRAEG